jgi:hypothetical protein
MDRCAIAPLVNRLPSAPISSALAIFVRSLRTTTFRSMCSRPHVRLSPPSRTAHGSKPAAAVYEVKAGRSAEFGGRVMIIRDITPVEEGPGQIALAPTPTQTPKQVRQPCQPRPLHRRQRRIICIQPSPHLPQPLASRSEHYGDAGHSGSRRCCGRSPCADRQRHHRTGERHTRHAVGEWHWGARRRRAGADRGHAGSHHDGDRGRHLDRHSAAARVWPLCRQCGSA